MILAQTKNILNSVKIVIVLKMVNLNNVLLVKKLKMNLNFINQQQMSMVWHVIVKYVQKIKLMK